MKLYEIANQIEQIIQLVDEDGVLLPEAEILLDKLEMDKLEKFKNIGQMIKNLNSFEEEAKSEKQRIDKKRAVAENLSNRLKSYLKVIMEKNNDTKIQAGTFTFSFRKSSSIVVDDANKLPIEFQKIEISAKKSELAEALKSGKVIEGVSVEHKQNLIIS